MNKQKSFKNKLPFIILFVIALINLVIVNLAGTETIGDYIWYVANELVLYSLLAIFTYKLTARTSNNGVVHLCIALLSGVVISTIIHFFESCIYALSIPFGSVDVMLKFGPKVFFDSCIIGPYLWSMLFWAIYCSAIYIIRYCNSKRQAQKGDAENHTNESETTVWHCFAKFPIVSGVLFVTLTVSIFKIYFEDLYGVASFISHLKYISFFMLMICVAKLCNRTLTKSSSSILSKRLYVIFSTVFVLLTIILLNNAYHFVDFGVQFDWPIDVTYSMFLKDDLTYAIGIGILRYPAVILAYLLIYACYYYNLMSRTIEYITTRVYDWLTIDDDEQDED